MNANDVVEIYPNAYPGVYCLHIDIRADSDRDAVALQEQIVSILKGHNIMVSQHQLTDADDWTEYVHHDDHPDAMRVGLGRRVVLDENGRLAR